MNVGADDRSSDEIASLREELSRRDAELAVINRIQEAVGAALDFQAIVDVVGDRLREVFGTGDLSILWWDDALGHAEWLYAYEHGARLHDLPPLRPKGDGFYARLVRDRRTLNFANREQQRAAGMFGVPGTDIGRSVIAVPMVAADRFLGNVFVENHERDDAFGPADVRLIETVTASMTMALLNARALRETEQRSSELAVINSIHQGMAAQLDFQAIVDLVGDKLREVFASDDMRIVLKDPGADLMRSVYVYEHGRRLGLDPSWPEPGSGQERIHRRLVRGETVLYNSLAEKEGNIETVPGTDPCLAVVLVPIVNGERFIGHLQLEDFRREHAFDASDVRLLQTIAASMSVALENARLFDETQQALEQQRASAEVLAAIGNSVVDTAPVFHTILDACERLFDTDQLAIFVVDDQDRVHTKAWRGVVAAQFDHNEPVALADSITGRVIADDAPLHVRDLLAMPGLTQRFLVNQKLAMRLLQKMGYRADLAADGFEAVESVARRPYDVVLMDVQMPEMDGLEATRAIVERFAAGRRPRIVAMTANAMQGDRERCLDAGMDDYLTKPIRVDRLVDVLINTQPRKDVRIG